MAATRATGISWPSAIRSAGSRCGAGSASAHGSPVAEQLGAVWIVKSAGATSSSSSHATGNDTGTPGTGPRAVGGDHGGPAGAGGVDEHLALAVVLDERRRRDARVEALGPLGDRPGRRGRVLHRRLRVDRHEHVHALGAARLHGAGEADVGERLAHEVRRPRPPARTPSPSGGSRSSTRWVARSRRSARRQRRVVLDGPLVGEPQQRPAVVAQRVGHRALRRLGPQRHRRAPTPACTSGTFFCMNGAWPRVTRITDSGRSRSSGRIRSWTPSR